jgi:5-methyltetrahydropteroyltriglutamate--homocysteine methyltransferase
MTVRTTCLGFPRIGAGRELKRALEAYWAGKIPAARLLEAGSTLRRRHWTTMRDRGMRWVPTHDFSLYDHVLDMAAAVGAVPRRYQELDDPLERYFAMARGRPEGLAALEMTKWFDTNYHYLVPELEPGQGFVLDAARILAEVDEARALGVDPRPVLVGPVSFLRLSKGPLQRLPELLPLYEELLELLASRGVGWVQLDEPCLVLDLDEGAREGYRLAMSRLADAPSRPAILLATYFGALGDNVSLAMGFEALHLDLVRAPEQLEPVLRALPERTALSLGVIDGRNVWRADLDAAHARVRRAVAALGPERVIVAPSCSLLHVPVDLCAEQGLDPELTSWLAFATQKLEEVCALAEAAEHEVGSGPLFEQARQALASRRSSHRTHDPEVRQQMRTISEGMMRRTSPFSERSRRQQARFGLPPLPTTTIGSFPQTPEVRKARAAWRSGELSAEAYEAFLRVETRSCVQRQEALGLDVLVHGELERNDMVEYFGEQLAGFAFTEQGWVQSYGSRCVKPPILYGDVARPAPMTTAWSVYAQGLTARPMKGMLTGPVTLLQWSFVRDDQPRRDTAMQLALALRAEVRDLQAAGIAMIQVDEPALREGLPLRQAERGAYLQWAVDAFGLATAGVRDETQIHTHMCYAEFGDILPSIAAMDADVLSIETSRSKMELLEDFGRFSYPNAIGPGVYDIHSPRVPTEEEMVALLLHAAAVLPAARLWVNPDCGLKTRGWPEVEAALARMVSAARRVREQV